MFERLISFSIYHRWLVLITTFAIGGMGLFNYQYLPIDAVPDITNVQVQINTEAIGYSPFEVEQQITFPIESVLSGLPSLQYTRSLSKYGLSQVTVVFEDGTDIYFARQLINERLSEARDKLPKMITPKMGPIATGLGEIFMYTVGSDSDDRNQMSATDLRTVQDWIIKPQLRTVPGVVEVNSIGGYQKKFVVSPKLDRLLAHGITFDDLTKAILENNLNRGAGYIEKTGEQFLVRAPGQVHSIEDIGLIPVANHSGVPVSLAEVADISLGSELRSGAATEDGKEVVLGTVFMLMGQNSRTVSQSVSRKMEEINRSLPKGVIAKTVYDRTTLVNATIATVRKNLFEGALLVIVILFFMLGNARAALITACIIPLSMLITITGMVGAKISGNLMSLGALDFGLIVDGAVILVENCIRRFSEEQRHRGRSLTREERLVLVKDASLEVRQATMFGELIIMIVYLPILTLTGVEGKMFHPMAFTVLLALAAAMILSVTFVPAVVALFLTGDMSETEPAAIKWLKVTYERLLRIALKARRTVIVGGISILIFSLSLATRMGTEFIPSLDEGDIALHALRIPGTSLTEAVKMQHRLEERIKQFPEVKNVFAKIGTAEIANDPMPPNVADGFVILKPRAEWPNARLAKAELVAEIEKAVMDVPGNNYEFTQPIQMRFNELIAGVRSDVAVKIFGDDLETLLSQANIVSRVLSNVSGAADVKVEQVTGLPMLSVVFDRQKLSRLGISLSKAQDVLATALGGETVGSVFEGDKRIEIVLRLSEENRNKLEIVRTLLIPVPPARESHGKYLLPISQEVSLTDPSPPFVQLGEVATIEPQTGPNQIGRENGKRRVVVTANVRGRALGSFVEDAQARVAQQVTLPVGYWISWGGQFEQLISAKKTLMIVVPLAIALILLLLYATLKNIADALLVFSGVPLALTGGIFALCLRGIPLSISAAVGFIALSGVAVLNGLVMISFINGLMREGVTVMNSTIQGSVSRLRPVLMTALVASLGFVPMALSQGTGAEVQRPLATVVIGGILSSTILTLFVLPALYSFFHRDLEYAG